MEVFLWKHNCQKWWQWSEQVQGGWGSSWEGLWAALGEARGAKQDCPAPWHSLAAPGAGGLTPKWAQVPNIPSAHVLKASRSKALPQTFSSSQTSPVSPCLVFIPTWLVAAKCPSHGWYGALNPRRGERGTQGCSLSLTRESSGSKNLKERKKK